MYNAYNRGVYLPSVDTSKLENFSTMITSTKTRSNASACCKRAAPCACGRGNLLTQL